MRVISGSARGRPLKAPRGMTTRPMADKIREAAYSMLASMGVEPHRVLDLYSGSGSVSIEALSRGAEWADLVDQSAAACAVARDNLRTTGFADRAAVHQTTVAAFLSRARGPYDFVILDPPYADPHIVDTLRAVGDTPAVEDRAIVLIGPS
ncbi:MAG: RsmD family RNA methyltransferase, partial [Thermomicrobiaceae bacterium]|nr:RsmD family RNA methyltransferase [Thermomicrobiaceae bacterium]